MKRAILTIFLLFAVMAGVCAAEAVLVPTLAVNTEDQVKGVLPARPLYIPRVSQVVRGQSFELVSGVVDPEFRNEKLQLNGTLTIKTPDGSEKIVFKNAKMFAFDKKVSGIIISNVQCNICFEESDKDGSYVFSLSLYDPAERKKILKSKPVTVVLTGKKSDLSPVSEKELSDIFTKYYLNPRPERLLAALDAFWKLDVKKRSEKNKKYEPRIFLYGFAEAFRLNPHLWDELPEHAVNLSKEQKKLFAMLLVGIGSDAVAKLTPRLDAEVLETIRSFKQRNPLYIARVRSGAHLDCLWIKYMITGRLEPVKQIAAELRKKEVFTLEQAKAKQAKGEKLTPEEIKKFNNFIITMAAYWSLQSNIRQNHRLLKFYLEAIVVRKEYVDNTAGSLLVAILKKSSEKNNKTTSAAEEKRNKQKEL